MNNDNNEKNINTTESLGNIDTLGSIDNNPFPGAVNLQPEGVAKPIEPEVATQSNIEPLMSAPLTSETNLNESQNMNNSVYPNQMDMGNASQLGNNNINQINPINSVTQNNSDVFANQMNMNNQFANNGINPMNENNMMGVPVPPQVETEKPSKPKNSSKKIFILLIVVVLIAAVGVGVYFVLNKSKNKVEKVVITPIVSRIELGSDLDYTKASTLVKVTGYDINSCTVTGNLNVFLAGTYSYTVTCGNTTLSSQTVEVKDTTVPVVELKEVVVRPNSEVSAMDFVASVTDASPYTAEYVTKPDTSAIGTYEVSIIVSDAYDNKTEELKGTLVVSENAPESYLICTSDNVETKFTTNYRFGISECGTLYNQKKELTYTLDTKEAYEAMKNEYKESKTINGVKGLAVFNDKKLEVVFTYEVSLEDLAKEFNLSEFPTVDGEIEALFPNGCEIEGN